MPMLGCLHPRRRTRTPPPNAGCSPKVTDLLLDHEGADPSNEAAQSIAWIFVHRPEVYAGGEPAPRPIPLRLPGARGPVRRRAAGRRHGGTDQSRGRGRGRRAPEPGVPHVGVHPRDPRWTVGRTRADLPAAGHRRLRRPGRRGATAPPSAWRSAATARPSRSSRRPTASRPGSSHHPGPGRKGDGFRRKGSPGTLRAMRRHGRRAWGGWILGAAVVAATVAGCGGGDDAQVHDQDRGGRQAQRPTVQQVVTVSRRNPGLDKCKKVSFGLLDNTPETPKEPLTIRSITCDGATVGLWSNYKDGDPGGEPGSDRPPVLRQRQRQGQHRRGDLRGIDAEAWKTMPRSSSASAAAARSVQAGSRAQPSADSTNSRDELRAAERPLLRGCARRPGAACRAARARASSRAASSISVLEVGRSARSGNSTRRELQRLAVEVALDRRPGARAARRRCGASVHRSSAPWNSGLA